jgi:hypothetical protein
MRKLFSNVLLTMMIALAMVVTAYSQSTDRPKNEIEIRGTYSIPSGDANFSGTTSSGSTLDFSRDFDFKNQFGFQLRYAYRSSNGKHKIVGDYDNTSWSRGATLSRSFTFGGETYVANAAAKADLKLTTFRAMYAYRWGNDKIRIGPMVDMGIITTHLDITGTTNSGIRSSDGSISKFAATVGYDLDYDPTPKINVFNNLGAIAFQGEHLFHAEGGVKVFPARHFGVSGGYRFERYKVKDNDNFVTVRQHGPFFGGVLRF